MKKSTKCKKLQMLVQHPISQYAKLYKIVGKLEFKVVNGNIEVVAVSL